MAESKSDQDWLPPGWTVKERVRKSGKKDKYYHAPSNGPTFNSRVEVSRYLIKTKQSDHCEEKRNNQSTSKQSEKFSVEQAKAEGLPQGWIKEIRLRKSDNKIRRDPFYYDPVNNHVFRSLKAVNRYLKAQELGTLPQNSEVSSQKDSDDDHGFSTIVIKKQQLGVSRTRRQIKFGQSSDMNEMMQEEKVQYSSSQPSPLLDHASNLREGGTELKNSDLQEAEDLDQKREKGAVDEVLPAKQSHESGKPQHGLGQPRKKMVPDLPRRASKRLSGLEVEPISELKPRTRARRVGVEESGNRVADTSEGSPGTSTQCAFRQPNQLDADLKSSESSQHSNKSKNVSNNLVTSEKQGGKVDTVINCDEKQMFPVSQISPYDKADTKKIEAPLASPLGELLTDPCIAFAIKTLTGVSFYKSESPEVLPGSLGSEHSSVEIFRNVETESNIDGEQDQRSAVSLEEHSRSIETDLNTNEKSGSAIELPFEALWQDPCIEFAIKTLTDAIPIDYNSNVQQYFQQQLSSSKPQGSDEMSFTNVGLHSLSQSNFSCQQFSDYEKPGFRQELQVPQSGRTVGLQSSDRSALSKHGKERQ